MSFTDPFEIANLNILNITIYSYPWTILFSEMCYWHISLQEIRSIEKEMKTGVTYLGIVLGEHGSLCLAKDVSFGRVMGNGGRVVILDYKKNIYIETVF